MAQSKYDMEATITQKILAAHSGRKFVEPGEFIEAKIDWSVYPLENNKSC